jgi:hypothetical protein
MCSDVSREFNSVPMRPSIAEPRLFLGFLGVREGLPVDNPPAPALGLGVKTGAEPEPIAPAGAHNQNAINPRQTLNGW